MKTSFLFFGVGIIGVLSIVVFFLWSPNFFASKQVKDDQTNLPQGMRPVGVRDHILGNPNAPIKIVEYSELECEICKKLHVTLERVMNKYGSTGEVAWVYRHFPLTRTHPKSWVEAQAAECVSEQGGEEAFWKFLSRFYEITPSNNETDLDVIFPLLAQELMLDTELFRGCIESEKYLQRVKEDWNDAQSSGALFRPWTFVISNTTFYTITGAKSYEIFEQLIESELKKEKTTL